VDRKLVELACARQIVTNDFNLNKVASVQGVGVNVILRIAAPPFFPVKPCVLFFAKARK
jgi:uncharacterized protein YacL